MPPMTDMTDVLNSAVDPTSTNIFVERVMEQPATGKSSVILSLASPLALF